MVALAILAEKVFALAIRKSEKRPFRPGHFCTPGRRAACEVAAVAALIIALRTTAPTPNLRGAHGTRIGLRRLGNQ
jgi:hypothetical protein